MYSVEASAEINATPERVWQVLSDLKSWREWQEFLDVQEGEPVQGTRLKVRFTPPGGMKATLRPVVLRAEPGRELRWLGHVGVKGIFDGEHSFHIEPAGDGRVRFVQREEFRGALVWLFRAMGELRKAVAGFENFNRGLKEQAEAAP